MEKASISAFQLFILAFLFEIGSSLLVALSIGGAKQAAWISILMGASAGIVLFFIYYLLYRFYPRMLPVEYMQVLLGSTAGKIIGFIYILDFIYRTSRNLRDFGEILTSTFYVETPLFVLNALFILTAIYGLSKGIEVLARSAEVLFYIFLAISVSGFLLIAFSGLIDVNNLKPVLPDGFRPVFRTFYTETLFIPFGEIFAVAMILPYVKNVKKAGRAVLYAIIASGIMLALTMMINISVLGPQLAARAPFPLLSTIQSIQLADFFERLDIYFILFLIIGGFFKLCIYFYAAVIGISSLFNIRKPSKIAYPVGVVALILSIAIASNFSEHIQEGHKVAPLFIQVPLQFVIPILLLMIAIWKNRKQKKAKKEGSGKSTSSASSKLK
ncbi:GerAB/ArcD/ProY family transporter [Domibacillus indicus]|uniref:GerAB/ArcD/ProY family transporter n=1 Tax=Domibacillus indicus TaxID=1437523 RepID=UPI000617C948|nr:GerAB/ArcD/ProY family transporter [Domibacillus indicus]